MTDHDWFLYDNRYDDEELEDIPAPTKKEIIQKWFWKFYGVVKIVAPYAFAICGMVISSPMLLLFAIFLIIAFKPWVRPVTITDCNISNSESAIVVK